MFIAFEGLDGSGSTTQAKLLAERLEKAGKSVFLTKEPTTDTPLGKLIREALQHKWKVSPEGFQLLFSADRAEHLKNEIEPALEEGGIVISDRYFLSTLAYGGLNVDIKWLKELNKNFIQPDLTFLLKLSPEECLKRITNRGTEVEFFEKKEKLEKIWTNYEKVAQEYENIYVVEADRSIEVIEQQIEKITLERLNS